MKKASPSRIIRILLKSTGSLHVPSVTQIKNELDDPFKVLVSCILSLRTRDDITYPVSKELFKSAPDPISLANMPLSSIKKKIKSINYYKTKAERIKEISFKIIKEHNSKVPEDFDELMKFRGVGRKTANIVMVYGFGKPGIAVDTHVHRISNRLGWVNTKSPEETEFSLRKLIPKKQWIDINEIFVMHGQSVCTPISPKCSECKISKFCPKIGVAKKR